MLRAEPDDDVSLERVTVLLVDDDETWTRATARLLARSNDAFQVETANSLHAGRTRFEELDPDCVVCDYRLDDGTGLDLLETVRATDPSRPFILVTGHGDEKVASEAIGQRVTDYIRKDRDDADSELLSNRVLNAVRNYRTERALQRERRSKDTMLDILKKSTDQSELTRQFCTQLVEEDGYACAWVGKYDGAEALVPRAVAGRSDYLDEVVADQQLPETEPGRRALDTDELVTVPDVDAAAAAGESWATIALDYGFESAVAVPVSDENVRFGVLAVYRDDDAPVSDRERELVREYADTMGYALRTAERKRSLIASESVTIRVEVADDDVPLVALARALPGSPTLEVRSAVLRDDGATLYVADVLETDAAALADVRVPAVDDLTVRSEGPPVRCEILAAAETPENLLAAQGAKFVRTVARSDGTVVTVEVPDDSLVKQIRRTLESEYDDASVSMIWSGRSSDEPSPTEDPLAQLTDRQREVLRHALEVGYFNRPRDTNATELAEQLGITRATLTQHLRTAERKILTTLLST